MAYTPPILQKLGFDKSGSSGAETDPVFSASEAANFVAGDKNKLDSALQDISGQDLSTADNSTSQFITAGDIPAETDPIVGAVSGIVKANGAGTISAATEGTDYLNKTNLDLTYAPISVTQYTDEMAQDAVGGAVGAGLSYDDPTGAISVGDLSDTYAVVAHAATHAVGGAQTVFPADPGADKFLMWDDDPGQLVWADAAGGLADGDYGDITVGGSGTTMTIDNDAVTYAKMQNVSATAKVLGRKSAEAGNVEELDIDTDLSSVSGSDDTVPSAKATKTALDLKSIKAGDTYTGAHDFGGADSVEIPNGTNPTTDAAGEIAVDTSSTPGSGIRFYGDQAYTVPGTFSKSFVIINPTTSSDYALWRTPYAITIKAVHGVCKDGTNVVGHLTECDANGANAAGVDGATDMTVTTSNTNDDGSLSNPSIDANDYVGWRTTSVSGTVTAVTITFEYTIDQVN